MELIPRWAGLAQEWQLLRQAWRDLPDNPLWILAQRMQAHGAPRLARQRRPALIIGISVVLAIYGVVVAGQVILAGKFQGTTLLAITVFGFVTPLAILYLLSTVLGLMQRSQAWLGRERTDAKHTALARLDPHLCLTAITPRDLVVAALRELLPPAALATAVSAGVALLVLVTAQIMGRGWPLSNPEELLTILAMSPISLGAILLTGLAGGAILILLGFSLGLNSTSPVQRSALALLTASHQFFSLWVSMAYMAGGMQSGGVSEVFGPLAFSLGYLLLACFGGMKLALSPRRASSSWLLVVPLLAVFGFWMATACVAMLSFMGGDMGSGGLMDQLGRVCMQLLSLWASINLFVPGALPSPLCLGDWANSGDTPALMAINFLAVVAMLACLLALAYRSALACAALRLRALD